MVLNNLYTIFSLTLLKQLSTSNAFFTLFFVFIFVFLYYAFQFFFYSSKSIVHWSNSKMIHYQQNRANRKYTQYKIPDYCRERRKISYEKRKIGIIDTDQITWILYIRPWASSQQHSKKKNVTAKCAMRLNLTKTNRSLECIED